MPKISKIFLLITFVVFGFFIFGEAKAGSADNVSGWAWSENIGWISFNCYNDYNGDGILESHCTDAGYPSNYGVKLDPSTGVFSGYAWSENIGWIDFAPAGPYPSAPSYSACLDLPGSGQTCDGVGDYKVSGWAKAITDGGGWDGWIHLRNDSKNYGVWLDTSTSPQEFRNWAWSDMVIGWLSFNCKDVSCATSSYKVYLTTPLNQPPVVVSTSDSQNPCAWGTTPQVASGLSVNLSWTYFDPDGDPQAAYEIWLDDNSGFPDPKFSHLVATSSANSYALDLSHDDNSDWLSSLNWGTTYYWKVKVKDSAGNWSNWSTVDNFTTPAHAYPYIDFKWSPTSPTVNEVTQFTDLSEVYGGATTSFRYWTFQDGDPATFSSATSATSTAKFTSTGQKNVSLKVTDSNSFSCTDSKTVNVSRPLPEWREVPPL